MKKNLLLYFLIVGVFTFLIWYFIDQGKEMVSNADKNKSTQVVNNSPASIESITKIYKLIKDTTNSPTSPFKYRLVKKSEVNDTTILYDTSAAYIPQQIVLYGSFGNPLKSMDTLSIWAAATPKFQWDTLKLHVMDSKKESETMHQSHTIDLSSKQSVLEQFSHNVKNPLSLLLLQIIVILSVAKIFGVLATKIGQPSVVGEIFAGIFLGPSIIGYFFPDFSLYLFPVDSQKTLQFLSQIGLAFFMFIVGMELDLEKLQNKARNAIVISHASIIVPFFLGVVLAGSLYVEMAPANVSFLAFALFMGIALSITAFPVLARIIQERGLTKTPLGAMVITCAAADDVTAWCILAAVIAIVKAGSIVSALFTITLALIFVMFMLKVIGPWIKRKSTAIVEKEKISKGVVAIAFFILLMSAYVAELIGIHALFGAFIAGVIMPHNVKFKDVLAGKIEDVSVLLLLPIFFAFTGLRTHIEMLNQGHLWGTCMLVIAVAVAGKFGGSALSAKLVGQSWKDSLSIGALMNTRGLMELIVLNIGLDLKILSPAIFSIMVLMALATTFMTGPSLSFINFVAKKLEDMKSKKIP
jgi:Kef-type K+ transport system membrane component KefB